MGLFSGLSEKLTHAFQKLTNKGKLSELEIKTAMREIRLALLEADVNFSVVKSFIQNVSEKAYKQEILNSLTASQQVIKIVNEELIELMGSTVTKLNPSDSSPAVIMLCGLQGAGKTTMCGKLALMLKKQGKTPLLAACDIYRPAAINQLQIVGKKAGVPVFEKGTQNPVKTAKQAVEYAKSYNYDTLIIDTAGRLHINDELMEELSEIKKQVSPSDILLTVDAMTGQDAVNVAETFNSKLDITGVILTKLDGDTRGGAALSIKAVTGKPIKFCGTGEKIEGDGLEPFYPDRMASRILGMGDVLTLIEKAQEVVSEEQAAELEKKFREQSFTLEDFLVQFENVKKMGGVGQLLSMLPGAGQMNIKEDSIDENRISHMKAIILSMTRRERIHPETIKSSQRLRIAKGSGTSVQEVNQLLKQYEQTKDMLKKLNSKKFGKKLPFMNSF